jgi:hypothetical protein
MDQFQINKPIKLNLDKTREELSDEEAFFLLNHERSSNVSSGVSSLGNTIPVQANIQACDVDQPLGENYRVGNYRSPITNEVYSWVYNSNAIHYIQRINGDGDCEIIYSDDCLKLSAHPRNEITEFRAYLRVEKICSGRHGKYLVWVDGDNEDIFYIDVEASILTNNFTSSFFSRCPDPCAVIQLCVPKHCGCIDGQYLPLLSGDASLTNTNVNVGVKFMVRFVYYDLRVSEWGDRSKLFYQDTKGCFDNSEGFPRCLQLRLPLGNPMVDKIELAYSIDNGNTWMLYDTIEKYESYTSIKKYWYQRNISSDLTIDPIDDCFFLYNFCNDRQAIPIDPKTISRAVNPMPRQAQGVIPIKGSLGFYNYKKGNCPINRDEIKKMSVSLVSSSASCEPAFVNVTVRAVIVDPYNNRNQFIYRDSGNYGEGDDPKTSAVFGGVRYASPYANWRNGFDQNFDGSGMRNFVAYIEGTNYSAEMKQYRAKPGLTEKVEVGVLASGNDASKSNILDTIEGANNFYFQECTFRVPKGTRGFIRLYGHHSGGDHNTSTFVRDILTDIYAYNYKTTVDVVHLDPKFEIYFEACSGNLDIHQAFIVADGLAAFPPTGTGPYPPVPTLFGVYGYVKINGVPVEGIQVNIVGQFTGEPVLATTDHNGFYSIPVKDTSPKITDREVVFKAEQNCGDFVEIHRDTVTTSLRQNIRNDVTIASLPAYATNFLVNVNASVHDCAGANVGGVPVAVSGTKYKVTDASGNVTFKVRNNAARNRGVRAVVMDKGGCFLLDCASVCNPCLPMTLSATPVCFDKSTNGGVEYAITMAPFVVRTQDLSLRRMGLKRGGRYGFAALLESPCGKISAAYELGYLDIPRLQADNKISFPGFSYSISGTMNLPFDGCLKILRTENQNPFELQWIVDKAERLNGKIKLTIQSLNDYNSSFFFKTNTIYKYLDGDRVEFIRKGSGAIFDVATYGVLNYKTLSPFNDETISNVTDNPDFFNQLLILDDGRLDSVFDDLKGSLIEMQRTKKVSSELAYFEICTSIPIVNGHPTSTSGTFDSYDSYIITRDMGAFTQTLEHHSPSDFWGERLSDIGKFHAINKYENEYRVGRGISMNSPTQFNYFGDLEKVFDAPEQGDIVAMGIKDGVIILAIGENDNFLAQAGNDLVRVGGDGIIRALPADAIISDAQPKVSGAFGCHYDDVGSVYFGDGFATWVSGTVLSFVKHDYNQAVDVSENKVQSYFRKKMQDVRLVNSTPSINDMNRVRFCTGFNPITSTVYLTTRSLRGGFINNSRAIFSQVNETIAFHYKSNDFTTFMSFTPEGYSLLDMSTGDGCSFLTFKNGIPFIHTVKSSIYNKFYTQAVDRVVGISINKFPQKRKVAISVEVHDDKMWFAEKVITSTAGFLSEIPPIKMIKENDKWSSSFFANKIGREGLYGRDVPRGFFIDVVLVRDNTDSLKYGTFDDSKRILFDELNMILTKFMIMEQSGMTENL